MGGPSGLPTRPTFETSVITAVNPYVSGLRLMGADGWQRHFPIAHRPYL
jgi:hypothetical protein